MVLIVQTSSSQTITYYAKNESYAKQLTKAITYEQEILRIDSFCARILADTVKLTRNTSKQVNGETHYYWKGQELVCAMSSFRDTLMVNPPTTNKVEWFFEDNHAILMRQTVRFVTTGKYLTKDRYYFNKYPESGVAQGMLFAWFKFGKRIHENCDMFDKVNSSLPFQGQAAFHKALELHKSSDAYEHVTHSHE